MVDGSNPSLNIFNFLMYKLKLTIKTVQPITVKNLKKIDKIQKLFTKSKNLKKSGIIRIINKKNYTLLKSPHVFKKSQEHFIYKEFKYIFNTRY